MNTSIFRAAALSFLFAVSLPAHAELLCAKKKVTIKNGKFNLAAVLKTTSEDTCQSGYQLVKDLSAVKDSQLIGFATVNRDAAVKNYGGNAVTTVSATKDQNGGDTSWYRITFTGTFSALSEDDTEANRDKVTVLASPITFDYPAMSSSVASAKRTEIKIDVATWKSDQLSPLSYQGGVYVALLLGAAVS